MTMIPEPDTTGDFVEQEQANEYLKESTNPKERFSLDVEEIDKQFMDAFRELLNEYIETLSTDISEIAEGLKLSRPVVSEFMNPKHKRNDLSLSIGRICHLHETLTEIDKLQTKRRKKKGDSVDNRSDSQTQDDQIQPIKKIRDQAKEARVRLKKDGPDRLLIAAGFQPQKMKMVPVSPQQYSQLSFISFLYKNRPFSQDIFFQIIERQIDPEESKNNKFILIEELKNNSWIDATTKKEIERKYNNAIQTIDKEGLTLQEKIGLFNSVMFNQLNKKEEIDFKLRVIRVERIPLSLTWDVKRNKDFNLLWKRIKELSFECEKNLGNSSPKNNQLTYPVTRTIVTCKYGEGEDEINFEYISTGTHGRTAISAISLNMGFYHLIPTIKVDIKCFTDDIKSLIKALVILRDENEVVEELVIGEWVSSDLLQVILQATIIASKKWLLKKINPTQKQNLTDKYKLIVEKNAEIRSSFYQRRIAFDGYDFSDGNSIEEFKRINSKAQQYISYLKYIILKYSVNGEIQIWNNFLSNFHRISLGSQLYILRHHNIQSNYQECNLLFKSIDAELYDIADEFSGIISETLISSKIALEAEKIFYNLSFGIPAINSELQQSLFGKTINLLTVNNILECLDKMDDRINEYLKQYVEKIKSSNDPGYDIHYGLGSYYSNTAKLLLYRATNNKDIKSACDRLLKAIYYFHRIGLSRKVERNLTLAGRVKVRSKREEYVKQCEKLSRIILHDSINKINAPSNKNFELAMYSRVNSLQGEFSLIIEDNKPKSLKFCLEALRGSLWLGLNRHIADNLYTISRCAATLQNRVIKADLEKEFSELWSFTNKRDARMYASFIHTPQENKIGQDVVSILFDIRKIADESKCWSDVAINFREASENIWNTWYRTATGEENGEHPFAIEIREGRFLEPINNPS